MTGDYLNPLSAVKTRSWPVGGGCPFKALIPSLVLLTASHVPPHVIQAQYYPALCLIPCHPGRIQTLCF